MCVQNMYEIIFSQIENIPNKNMIYLTRLVLLKQMCFMKILKN